MVGAWKGTLVGFANTVVVAFCIAAMADGPAGEIFLLIVTMGFIPGVVAGAVLGWFADACARNNRTVVLIAMIALACGAVALLGDGFQMHELVAVSCIPTAAACSVLERWTRPASTVPVARVA